MILFGLIVILLIIFAAPFLHKKIEEELEMFFFVMGCLAVTLTSQWSRHLILEALTEPIKITLAVFVAGFIFKFFQKQLAAAVSAIAVSVGLKLFSFFLIVVLGFLSSVLTAIISALVLVTVISHLKLNRRDEVMLAVLACFSIGLGAALTPIGEPLSAIVVAKLKGMPYNADFFFLFRCLGFYIISGVIVCGLYGATVMPNKLQGSVHADTDKPENIKDIFIRTFKVYLFVAALIFLGCGFKPLIEAYFLKISFQGLYWINITSAILDNATLAAAEISPEMGIFQIKSALLGLLIAGGMLIPGNIPNIITAGRLKIKNSA